MLDINDQELYVHDRLKQTHSAMDELIAQGTSILGSLRSQHMNLHGVKRRVLDIGQKV